MKKIKMGVVSLFIAFVSIFILASCGNKLPQTKYEKVKFAFNGVEESFKSASSSKESSKAFISNEDSVLLLADTDDALSTIGNLYTPGDNQGAAIFAFNGIEKSFKSASSSKKSSNAFISNEENVLLLADTDDALSTIENIYTPGDNQGDVIDELSYNEPPMIQFQYLKSILEKTGKDFEFGTKYYYDITDSMYADFITGKKQSESDEYNTIIALY